MRRSGLISSRSLPQAETAFEKGDVEASRQAHKLKSSDSPIRMQEDGHDSYGDKFLLLRDFVRYGLPGFMTACVVICGSCIAELPIETLWILGATILFGTGLAQGFMHYIFQREQLALYIKERERESWECENYLQGELDEMVELYSSKGLSVQDAQQVVQLLSKNQKLFVDIMMVEELGILPVPPQKQIILQSFLRGVAFFIFGLIPLAVAWHLSGAKVTAYALFRIITACSGIISIMGSFMTKFAKWWQGGASILGTLIIIMLLIFYPWTAVVS